MSRTDINWKKHELKIIKNEHVLIHVLKIPESSCYSVRFINTQNILAVTGDLGNWIFCREFHPSKDGKVSDHYWIEKLTISSKQNPYQFDTGKAVEEINEIINDEDSELSEEEITWLQDLKESACDGEYSYNDQAMTYPSTFEPERIPRGFITNYQLQAVFDAFDEICRRLNDEVSNVNNS